jgi:hypothetical protein
MLLELKHCNNSVISYLPISKGKFLCLFIYYKVSDYYLRNAKFNVEFVRFFKNFKKLLFRCNLNNTLKYPYRAMPYLRTHVQFIMPPIGSVGSGLASYRDMYCTLKDERENIYSPISSIMYMLTEVIRNEHDKVTLVASKMSSISCKPSNLVTNSICNYSSMC